MAYSRSASQGRTMSRKQSTSENHAKAPMCAAFVTAFRAVFGEVTVLYVRENGVVVLDRMKAYAPQIEAN